MITMRAFPRSREAAHRFASGALALQFLAAPLLALLVAFGPASGAAVETQDPSTEIITARTTFNGTDGSTYNSTIVGPQGAELGTIARNLSFGVGYWGPNATLTRLRLTYPGNLALASNNSTNEVFFSRGGTGPRDRLASGTVSWTAGTPTDSFWTAAFDQDGDGWLDDAVMGASGVSNRYYLYNQGGTQIGARTAAPNGNYLLDIAAVDTDANGVLDQVAFAHEGGLVYVERPPANNVWSVNVPGNVPVRFVAAVDLNGDGRLESVLAGADDLTPASDRNVYAYNGTGLQKWAYNTGGAGIVNLTGIEANGSHRVDGALVATEDAVTALAASGTVVWNWSANATVTAAARIDVNRDGVPEGAVYADDAGGLSILDGAGALVAWTTWLAAPIRSIDSIDLDGDGWLNEVVVANLTHLAGVNASGAWLWSNNVTAPFTINMVARADMDGYGVYGDTLVAANDSIYVFNRTGALRWNSNENRDVRSAAFIENPSAADAGSYSSGPIDAGTQAMWRDLDYTSAVNNSNETLNAWVRFGSGPPAAIVWGAWTGGVTAGPLSLTGNASRFAQVRFDFTSLDGRNSANLSFFRLNFSTPALTGYLITAPFAAAPGPAWLDLNAQYNLSGGAVRFFYSADGGANWRSFAPPGAIDGANASVPSLIVRIEMDVGTASPNVAWVEARYAQPGLRPAIVTPSPGGSVTGLVNVTAVADPLVGALTFGYRNLTTNLSTTIGPAAFDNSSSRWWWLWNTTALNLPAVDLWAEATDARGFSFTSTASPYEVDNLAPTAAIDTPAPAAVISGTVPINVSTAPDVASVLLSYLGSSGIQPIGYANQSSPGVWTTTWNTTAAGILEEGVRLYATATDEVGLSFTAEAPSLVVDNLDPWIRIDYPTSGASVNGTVRVNITASPDVTAVDLFQNGFEGAAVRVGGNATESWWVVNWSTYPDLQNPAASLFVQATDRAGHNGTASVSGVVIDNTAPQVTLVSPALPGAYTGIVQLKAGAPGADGYLAFYYRIGGQLTLIRNLTASEMNGSSGLYEWAWNTAGLNLTGAIVVEAAPLTGLVAQLVVDGLVIDNDDPFITLLNPSPSTPRIDGDFVVEAIADADAASVTLSYTNLATLEVVLVGSMTHAPGSSHWFYTWSVGSLFVPYASVSARATDGVGLSSVFTSQPLIIGLNPNDAPPSFVRQLPAVVLAEDFGSYELNLTGLIVDNDLSNLSVYLDNVDASVVTLRNNGARGSDPRLWFFSIDDKHTGSAGMTVGVRAVDSSGQTAPTTFTLIIEARNDAASWQDPHAMIFVQGGVPYEMDFSLYVHDVEFEFENASLSITSDDGSHVSQVPTARLALRFAYGVEFEGRSLFVNLSLHDQDAALAPPVFELRVVVTNDAVPRLVQPLPDIVLFEDTPKLNILDLNDYFVDADGEPLFYYSGLNSSFGVPIVGGVLSIDRLPANWFGSTWFFLGANDTLGAFSEARVNLTVLPVNDAPTWDFSRGLALSEVFVHFDVPFEVDLNPYIVDVDTPRANLTVHSTSPLQAFAKASNESDPEPGDGLVLILFYDLSFNGVEVNLILYATDGLDTSTTLSIIIHVSDNYPPAAIKPLPLEIVMQEGQTLSPAIVLSDYFSDPDGVLFYAFGLLNVTVSIDNATSGVSLSSVGEWSGTEMLIIRAIDNRSAFKDSFILITVLPVNDAPIIRGIPDHRIDAGTLGIIAVAAFVSDPDSPLSKLTYSVSTTYPGAFVTYASGNVSFVYPKAADPSVVLPSFDAMRLCVSDGERTTCRVIAVRIVQATPSTFNWLQFIIFVGTAGAGAIVVARHFIEFKIKRAPTVEDIFLVYEDGILIKHISKNVRKYADEDVVTSMLSAIQSFAADSFEDKGHWELREVQFQGRKILIERARKFQIILIFDGDANEDLKKAVLNAASTIQEKYKKHLRDWDGDPSHFDDVEAIFRPLLALQSAYIPKEVSADELVRAPFVPGEVYVNEGRSFASLIKTYEKDLQGLAVVRVRPTEDAGARLDPLKPEEVHIVEIAPPKQTLEEGDELKTGLDIAAEAVVEAVGEARVAVRGRAPLVLFEGFDWVLDRYGFVFAKKFCDQLKKLAASEGFYLFIAVDPAAISPQQLEGVERNAVVFRGA